MSAKLPMLALAVAVAMTCSPGGTVHAEGLDALAQAPAIPAADAAAEDGPPAAPIDAPLLLGETAIPPEELAAQRGGADVHNELSTITANGTVREVSVSDAMTGFNVITEGALAGTSGIPMVIQNSGNGVLIQNAVIVNVGMQ